MSNFSWPDRTGNLDEDGPKHWLLAQDSLKGGIPKKDKERFGLTAEPCPHCSKEMRWYNWSSSSRTWQSLCGRAGYQQACKKCKHLGRFKLTRMN